MPVTFVSAKNCNYSAYVSSCMEYDDSVLALTDSGSRYRLSVFVPRGIAKVKRE